MVMSPPLPPNNIEPDKKDFIELRQRAKKILDQLDKSNIGGDQFDRNQLLEELNVYHIELELQHEELQKTRDSLEVSRRYLNDLYAFAPIGYIVMTADGKIKDINQRAASYFQIEQKNLKGLRLQSFIPHESLIEYSQCLTKLLKHRAPQHATVRFWVHGGRTFWARIDQFLIKNPAASEDLILCSLLDVSKEKQSEEKLINLNQNLESLVKERTKDLEKLNLNLVREVKERRQAEKEAHRFATKQKTMLRELNHRVKNNMQIMVSLMKLQTKQTTDPQALTALMESQNRIKALAMIHDILYMADNLATIPFRQYLNKLSRHLATAYDISRKGIQIQCKTKIESLHIDQAVPLGLVITELITNSIKYAFPQGQGGKIEVITQLVENNWIELVIHDNGVGIPPEIDTVKCERLGLRLVYRIVEDQLKGSVTLDQNSGTIVIIRFPQKEGSHHDQDINS